MAGASLLAGSQAGRILLRLTPLLAAGALFFYFVQHARLPPNTVDGALILGYLEEICDGNLPYWDFIDVYGPLNWIFPALFYALAGREAWGVSLWMIVLKIISVAVTYGLVRRLSDRLHAGLAAFCATCLLGQPFQFLQTPYAFHTAYPLVLLAWGFVLCEPFGRRWLNPLAAGLCTATVLWIKLNAGLFLLLGGLFHYFYWLPSRPSGDAGPEPPAGGEPRACRLYRAARWPGLAAYGLVLALFLRKHFDALYFLYLLAPLLIVLAWTLEDAMKRRPDTETCRQRVAGWLCYFGVAAGGWLAFFLAYYGIEGGMDYLRELFVIVSRSAYIHPIPPIGVEGLYRNLSKWYWLQLPWLVTFGFCIWLMLQNEARGRRAFGQGWSEAQVRVSGIFALNCFYAYVIYPRSDEPHMYQALLPSVTALMVLLYHLERMLPRGRVAAARIALSVAVVLSCTTIATWPTLDALRPREGDWYGHRMRFLEFRPWSDPAVRNTSSTITDREWDMAINRTGLCVDGLTRNGSEVLVLITNQLINYISHTRPSGDRYRYLFYLLKNDLVDRETFEAIVPRAVWANLLENPPGVIVGAMGVQPLLASFPEMAETLRRRYHVVQKYAHIFIYLPKEERLPAGLCEKDPERVSGKKLKASPELREGVKGREELGGEL